MNPKLEFASKKSPGFTLLELIVCIGIVFILFGMIFYVSPLMTERSRATKCLGNLQQIGVGLNLYLADHQMMMPELAAGRATRDEEVKTLDTVLAPFLPKEEVFSCPSDRLLYEKTGCSYYWNVMLNGQSATSLNVLNFIEDKHRIPVASDKEGWHRYTENKVNLLFADGHASQNIRFFSN
jgi:prepilin-type processing-associated H-X9-DG protein